VIFRKSKVGSCKSEGGNRELGFFIFHPFFLSTTKIPKEPYKVSQRLILKIRGNSWNKELPSP